MKYLEVADLVDGTSYIVEGYDGHLFSAVYSASCFHVYGHEYDFTYVRYVFCTVDDFYIRNEMLA
jgi:hypothetical protein